MFRSCIKLGAISVLLLSTGICRAAEAVELELALPRLQYTTAESIDLALLYSNDRAEVKKTPLEVMHADGSSLTFEVPFDAPGGRGQTRIVAIQPGALKPGKYTATAKAGGKQKSVLFSVHSDQHPSGYFVGQWVHQGEARGTTLAKGGWMYMTSDLATVKTVPAKRTNYSTKLTVTQSIRMDDTPVGVGASPDGKTVFTLCHDGRVLAHDREGKQLWHTQALLEGCALAVSPKGDRLAVVGYPGLLVLDAKDGKVLGGFRVEPVRKPVSLGVNRMISVAWNHDGSLAGSGWLNPDAKTALDPVIVDSTGKVVARLKGVSGQVMGAVFIPDSNALLLGADQLTAVNAADGRVLWRNAIKGAQAFAFSSDGKTVAAGGWGKSAGTFALATPTDVQSVAFGSVVASVAFLPSGELAVAVWGGVYPLHVVRKNMAEVLFQSSFGFQNVVWSAKHKALLAAEQGRRVWLLGADGQPSAELADAGTTTYRLSAIGTDILVARMNRVVQRLAVQR
jgi:hypothetical protein